MDLVLGGIYFLIVIAKSIFPGTSSSEKVSECFLESTFLFSEVPIGKNMYFLIVDSSTSKNRKVIQ